MHAVLVGVAGLVPEIPSSPLAIDLRLQEDSTLKGKQVWPLAEVAHTGQPKQVEIAQFGLVRIASSPKKPDRAIVIPVLQPGITVPVGILVVGISPEFTLNDRERRFFTLVAGQIGTAIANTRFREQERNRAEALAELHQAKSYFLAQMSHQLRTPVNVVSFSADLLKRNIDQWTQEKNYSYLDLIQVSVQKIYEVLDEIMLFSQGEAQKLNCQPKQLNIVQFCRHIIAQMQLTSQEKLINFINKSKLTTAYLDPKLLKHILTNLLSNAIKYSPTNSKVTFQLCCQKENVIFQIKDTGIGIPKVDMQKIFEPFYRGSNVNDISGNGLGLSIVKTLVELHQGEITVESEVGVGTTFTVKLPSIKTKR
ncbi:GHKL domain-containing protein [Iningainema sp. BLCCT55]|uniref:histidine kinase n=2 Tax=Iningainema TaxID=1932705 RepID=A0A8J7C5N5_9CYAN|nr:GHKL domain-containing protein [Iningainema tapete BLCC-T55]